MPTNYLVPARAAGWKQVTDFHETPHIAVEALLARERFPQPIWEPACGAGAISEVLLRHKYKVRSTDLHDHGCGESGVDFLQQTKPWKGSILTNPPFNRAQEFMEHAISVASGKVAFLLRVACLAGVARGRFYAEHPFAKAYVFSKRLPMMHRVGYEGPKSTSTVDFMWLVWDPWHTGEPVVRFLP